MTTKMGISGFGRIGMTLQRILLTDSMEKKDIELLRKEGFDVVERKNLSEAEISEEVKGFNAIITRNTTPVTRKILESGNRLKLVARAGVGFDNIDVGAATEKGIVVMNVPAESTIAVAEHAIGIILAAIRKIPSANNSLRGKNWGRKKFIGEELYGKTLGIIGFGRIGSKVAERAKAFGMVIVTYDPYIPEEKTKNAGVELLEGLDELLRRADIITLHTPLTEETKGMIGEREINKMKAGTLLVNTARGGIIDENALYAALKKGKVAGAALDVFLEEPPFGSRILEIENVVVTPHIAGYSSRAQRNISAAVARQVIKAFREGTYENQVTMTMQPLTRRKQNDQ
ncbi:MAG: hydroxyacid dehydrogenase [Candidatus Diapherotrites archaeon]